MRFVALVLLICAGGISCLDEYGIQAQKDYCLNVEIFELQTNKPMHERDGHPNYKDIDCERFNDKNE